MLNERSRIGSVLLLLLWSWSCSKKPDGHQKLTPNQIATYASLPGIRKSAHRGLRTELERLEREQATPEAMARPADPAELPDGSQPTRDSRIRITRALVEILPSGKRREWMDQINSEFPRAVLRPDPANQRAFAELIRRWERPLAQAKVYLGRPDFGLYIPLDQGLLADLTCVEVVRTLVRHECLHAATDLLNEDLSEALVHWDLGGRWLMELASLPHAVSRAAAARGRIEWLRFAQSILQSPLAGPDTFRAVQVVIALHLTRWPADSLALRGDRAVGLHTYELLREGYWMSLLTVGELKKLRQRKEVEPFILHLATHLDDDEYFYLKAMRQMIDVADQPYYERSKELDAIRAEIDSLRPTPQYPWFAAEYLLPDVFRLQRWQAIDYQLAVAMHTVIGASLGDLPADAQRDPLTGDAWKWVKDDLATMLSNVYWPIDDTPLTVPTLSVGTRSDPPGQ